MKIRPLGAGLFVVGRWTNGRTNMTNLTVAFLSFEYVRGKKLLLIFLWVHTDSANAPARLRSRKLASKRRKSQSHFNWPSRV